MSQDYTTSPPPAAKKRSMKVFALTAICIILAASLVGVTAFYMLKPDLQAQLTQKDATIASLNQQIAALQANATSSSSVNAAMIATLTSQLSVANSRISELELITNINYTEPLVDSRLFDQQVHGTADEIFNDILPYAGYIVVTVNSNSTTTYARTTFRYLGTDFDFNQTIGTSGNAMLLVMPTYVEIQIGNLETSSLTNTTVSVDYYY
jgi:hypothetical protein